MQTMPTIQEGMILSGTSWAGTTGCICASTVLEPHSKHIANSLSYVTNEAVGTISRSFSALKRLAHKALGHEHSSCSCSTGNLLARRATSTASAQEPADAC
eukprot:1090230-Rhodomonas_salina.2